MKTSAFPKILHIGNKQISDLFEGVVEITEKVDGSQLGFGKVNGELFIRSKGKEQDLDNPDMMFEKAVEYIKSIEDRLPDNMTFYGEYLNKPKHNTLAYDRTPKNGIALFGVYDSVTREHFGMDVISDWAAKLDVETVPLLFKGETNAQAVLDGPADIGRLIKEVRFDITLEEKENIKEELWKIYKDDFMRHAVSGLPEWYKKKLATGDVDVETVKENGQGV